jgi:hypothetical protein
VKVALLCEVCVPKDPLFCLVCIKGSTNSYKLYTHLAIYSKPKELPWLVQTLHTHLVVPFPSLLGFTHPGFEFDVECRN